MGDFPQIFLAKGKERSIQRFHPWVFSGAIASMQPSPEEGDIVRLLSHNGAFLGFGHYQKGSIAVRVFSFQEILPSDGFWEEKLRSAWQHRISIGLAESKDTNAFRLIHAEGDGMPGLIADYYDGTVVLQAHSAGMYQMREYLAGICKDVLGDRLQAVYDRSLVGKEKNSALLLGTPQNTIVSEYGNRFKIDWETGQKTGFFLDQRENRKMLEAYVKGKKALNTFAYSGGFSVYALGAGAEEVHSVDVSEKAIALADENVALNGQSERHQSWAMEVFDFFKQSTPNYYDVIVLDPPAFAKSNRARHRAVIGYKKLNSKAFKLIKPGGIIFTFSCSQVVDNALFYNTITAAAIESGRQVRVLHHLGQPADHPVSIYHPEGAYLKGLVLGIE